MIEREAGELAVCKKCRGENWHIARSEQQFGSGKHILLVCANKACGNAAELILTSMRWLGASVDLIR